MALTRGDPPGEAPHWTGPMMAKACGMSAGAVRRIWGAHGLQPHKIKPFKLSNAPKLVERDVVGRDGDPPAHGAFGR